MNEELELKPCPFCGDDSPEITGDWSARTVVWIACTTGDDCTATGPERLTENDAIAAWNKRKGPEFQEIVGMAAPRRVYGVTRRCYISTDR